jgi:hypothetical protein
MAINKNFVVKNGLEIATKLIFADPVTNKVGIGNSVPSYTLDVTGNANISQDIRISGAATFPTATGSNLYYSNSFFNNSFTTSAYVVSGVVTTITGTSLNYSGIGTVQTQLDVGVGGATLTANAVSSNIGIANTNPTQRFQINTGTNLVSVTSIGNVGINSAIPTSKLYVVGDQFVTGVITASTYNGQIQSGLATISSVIGTSLYFVGVSTFTNSSTVLIGTGSSTGTAGQILQIAGINSSVYIGGNLGIGNTNPGSRFDVMSVAASSATGARIGLLTSFVAIGTDIGRSIEIGVGQSTLNTYLDFHGADDTYSDYAARLLRNTGANSNFDIINRGTGNIRLISNEAGNIDVYTTNTQRARVDKDGYFIVGAAQTSGTQLFQVQGGAYITGTVGIGSSAPGAKLNVVPSSAAIAGLFSGTTTADLVRLTQTGAGNIFVAQNADSSTTPFIINNSGNTGIGTSLPGAKLHVLPTSTGIAGLFSGSTSADMVRITQAGSGNAFVVEDSSNPDSNPFVIDTNGNVGILSATPTTNLDVIGTLGARIGLTTSYIAIGTDLGRNIEIGLGNSTGATYIDFHGAYNLYPDYSARLFSDTGALGNFDIVNRGGSIRLIATDSTGNIDFLTNNILRGRIDKDGTVSVGTATSTGTANQVFQVAGVSSNAYIGGQLAIGNTTAGSRVYVVPTSSEIAGVFSGTTSADMVRITQMGSGNAFVIQDSADPDTSPFVIDTFGRVIVGTTTGITMRGFNGWIQEHGTDDNTTRHQIVRWSNDALGPVHSFLKSKGTSVGSNVIAAYNDSTGELHFLANDGTDFVRTGIISAAVDGTAGLGSMPGRLAFYTVSAGSSIPIEAMRVNSGQVVLIGTATSTGTANQKLQIGTATTTLGAYISGFVGIASTNPSSNLTVGGNVLITGVTTSLVFNGNINATGVSTFSASAGPVLIGTGTSTGTAGQVLQVAGVNSSVYVGGTVALGATIAGARLYVVPTGSQIAGVFSGTTSDDMVRITQMGTGNALRIEDAANPDTSAFVIDQSGNTGIGTTAPNTELQINSVSPTITLVETDATTGNRTWIFDVDNQELLWKAQSDTYVSGTNFFRLTRNSSSVESFEGVNASSTWFKVDNANQKVGIGSTTISTQLDVIGSGGARFGLTTSFVIVGSDLGRNIEIGVGQSNTATYLDFHGSDDSFPDFAARLINNPSSSGTFDIITRGTGNFRFITSDAAAIDTFTNNILRGRITSDGTYLVGTGTSTGTSNQVFQVAGVSSNAYIGGQVAIGLTLPGARLHVVPTSAEIAGLFSGSSSSDLVRITQTGSGNALVVEDETNPDTTPFVINTSGDTGIGTNTVGAKLHVLPTTTGIAGLFSGTTSNDMVRITQLGSGNAFVVEDSTNPDSTPFVIDQNGSVGINTLTPSQLFQVGAGTSIVVTTGIGSIGIGTVNPVRPLSIFKDSSASNLSQINIQPLTSSNASGVQFINGSASNLNIGLLNTSGAIAGFSNAPALAGFIGLSGLNPLLVATNNIERLRIDPHGVILAGVANSTGTANQLVQVGSSTTVRGAYVSGDIGVGVTNPGAKVHIVPNASSIAGLFSGSTSADMVRITQSGTGNALVVEDAANPDSTPFVVTTTGFVGIGTTNPVAPLTVTDGNVSIAPLYPTDVAAFLTNNNTYTQVNFTNTNSGDSASGDYVVTADNGTDTTNYIDMGINNSGFTTGPSWSINGALDGYLYTSDGNLSVGAASAKYVSFFTGGLSLLNERLRITPSGLIGVATTNPLFQLDVAAGDIRVQNTNKMRFGGNSSTTNFYIQYNSTSNSLDFVAG